MKEKHEAFIWLNPQFTLGYKGEEWVCLLCGCLKADTDRAIPDMPSLTKKWQRMSIQEIVIHFCGFVICPKVWKQCY